MSNYTSDIFQYIKEQEAAYARPININSTYSWSMRDHIQKSENYNNSQLFKSLKTDFTPVKNITRPNLNLQHWTEDVDLKDVALYINDEEQFHLSLLVKKYHDDVFAVENDLDTFFDDLKISRIDLGGGLSKKLKKPCPEVVPLPSIAFCNQKDLLSSPFGILHEYSPDQLYEMEQYGWGSEANGATLSIDELVTLWHDQETSEEGIKVYEVHGNMPARFFDKKDPFNKKYETRIAIVAFYLPKGQNTEKKGVILYTALEDVNATFKLIKRDKVYGRALGFGGAEELFDAQIWTNYDMIRIQNMLDAAATTILKSTDPTVAARHPKGLKGMKPLEIIDIAPNTDLNQVDTFPRNMKLFETSVQQWEQHAKELSGAQDPIQGAASASGTPFAAINAQIQQGMGLHKDRRGQFARHLEEIYQDWIIPHIEKEITKDQNFLSTLSMEELQYVADRMCVNEWNQYYVNKVLDNGEFVEGEKEAWMQQWKDEFRKKGDKHFIKLLKGEFKNARVKVSVANKSSNLAEYADKITKILQTVFANPDGFAKTMMIPDMARAFSSLMEFSGLQPMDFSNMEKYMQQQQAPQTQTSTQPQLANAVQ